MFTQWNVSFVVYTPQGESRFCAVVHATSREMAQVFVESKALTEGWILQTHPQSNFNKLWIMPVEESWRA